MSMTHYMELLATNQPWNLILFMAIPVILAETLAITELCRLLKKDDVSANLLLVNKVSAILSGIAFAIIIPYLTITAVIPLTTTGAWRGVADVIAVISYLIGGIPLILLALQELNLINKTKNADEKMKNHVMAVCYFMVFAHIAMIFGMLDPAIMGYKGGMSGMNMNGMGNMNGMNMNGMDHSKMMKNMNGMGMMSMCKDMMSGMSMTDMQKNHGDMMKNMSAEDMQTMMKMHEKMMGNMNGMNMGDMEGMDHSKMNENMKDMNNSDNSKMSGDMEGMDHSKMNM